jgi:hypothetical protein
MLLMIGCAVARVQNQTTKEAAHARRIKAWSIGSLLLIKLHSKLADCSERNGQDRLQVEHNVFDMAAPHKVNT